MLTTERPATKLINSRTFLLSIYFRE